jgi:hypothetical protein
LCTARVRFTPALSPPLSDQPPALGEDDANIDYCLDTWSTLGRHDYFGTAIYEATLESATAPAGKKAYLWLSKVDGIAQVWVNDRLVRAKGATADSPPTAEAHLKSLTFDVSAAWQAGRPNRLVIAVQRTRLAELGAGGLLGPVLLYRDR